MVEITRVWIGNPFEGGHFNGTAFFIDEHTLVTAKHVVLNPNNELYENIFLTDTSDGGLTPVDQVILCERDIAILKVKKSFNLDKVLFSKALKQGRNVNIIGFYDKSSSHKSYENRISGYINENHTYELQNHLTHGLSGSPVLMDGKVCGITKAINSKKNITYVIPIEELCVEIDLKEYIEPQGIMDTAKTKLSVKDKILNEMYEVRIPFILFLVIFVILHRNIFSHGYELQDGIMTYIVFAYLSSKVALFIRKKIMGNDNDKL